MDFKGFRHGDGSHYSPCGLLPSAAPRAEIAEERCWGTPVSAISVLGVVTSGIGERHMVGRWCLQLPQLGRAELIRRAQGE